MVPSQIQVDFMHFLLTNDDGVYAPGLLALAQEFRKAGEVSILAPDHNWSASGHVKTLSRPLRVRSFTLADGTTALSSDGAPSDCVALALLGVIEKPVDMVISGINPNANIGHDVTYSGTVTAAMEAAIAGVPAIAVSLDAPEFNNGLLDFSAAAAAAWRVAEKLVENPLPDHAFLNVNVPYLPESAFKGYRISRQGQRIYRDELVRREDPKGRPYYWIGGEAPTGIDESGTDFGDIKAGYVSITPIQLDLTAHALLAQLRRWNFNV
jgi:5'-nucleotidase